jgi:hypothetical protein
MALFNIKLDYAKTRGNKRDIQIFGERNAGVTVEANSANEAIDIFNEDVSGGKIGGRYNPFYLKVTSVVKKNPVKRTGVSAKLPTYYGSGVDNPQYLIGHYTKQGALRAAEKRFITSGLKKEGYYASIFESPAGYYVVNVGPPMKNNPIKRTGVSAKTYINRKSQITKTSPTKRLKKRRTKITQVGHVQGYFPNPASDNFIVQFQRKGEFQKWINFAETNNYEKAVKIAQHAADTFNDFHTAVAVRVIKE